MPRSSHASFGTFALVQPIGRIGAQDDARRSFELVGNATTEIDYVDPILAARSWLRDPARSSHLDESLKVLATRAVDVAEAHVHELDMIAGQVALDAHATGVVDEGRLGQVDAMTLSLNRFSARLRDVLEAAGGDTHAATERIENALAVAGSSGFDSFVAAL